MAIDFFIFSTAVSGKVVETLPPSGTTQRKQRCQENPVFAVWGQSETPGSSVPLRLGQVLGSPSYTVHLDSHRFGKNAIIPFSSKLISTARLLTFHTIKESFIIPVVSHLQEMDRKFIITVTASIPLASFPQRRILIKSQNWRGCATFS